jgi:tetratricopeptide (TPR) repeat protein
MMQPMYSTSRLLTRRQTIHGLASLTVVSLIVRSSQASAAPISSDTIANYNAGRWQEAAAQAGANTDPDNQAFAARCLLAGVLLNTTVGGRTTSIARARQYAESALAKNPHHVEGRLQLATALGLQARAGSPARAYARGLPQKVRRLLDSVLRDAPGEAWAYALLGGWHLEGLRIGGTAASAMLGSDLTQGKTAFARAMRLDPDQAAPPFYFAASLLALNPSANAAEARALLSRSQACPPHDAFQAAVKARATILLQALDTAGPARAASLALGWL